MDYNDIKLLDTDGVFSELDRHFAVLMTELSGNWSPELFLASALLSRAASEGHVCLDLADLAGSAFSPDTDTDYFFVLPELAKWKNCLESSGVVGRPGDYTPLVLDSTGRLYLYRYWDYENTLAQDLRARATGQLEDEHIPLLKEGLLKLFDSDLEEETDWQKVAAFTALVKRFCVISGGPGTGKSSLIARILALMVANRKGHEIKIALAAPTGKAAARLQEAVRKGLEFKRVKKFLKDSSVPDASTIHRLLGSIKGSPYFRHNEENQLPFDTVVIDEASMVDIALLSKLARALSKDSRLILLGDGDQLASVQAGSVLGDLCETGRSHGFSKDFSERFFRLTGQRIVARPEENIFSGITDCVVQLRKNYRFNADSGISLVSRMVNQGEGESALSLLKEGKHADIGWKELPAPGQLLSSLRDGVVDGYRKYLKAREPEEAFLMLEEFRILCALRAGPYGVVSINYAVERILREEDLINPSERWYRGRPLMINRNDYNLGLFNGDMGIIMNDVGTGQGLRAFFQSPDGSLRKFLPQRLPEHETVYAVTVHKSQGSEFKRALLLLPDRYSPVLTRELIYTGLTRVREQVEVWGREPVFLESVRRRISRASGLRDALWNSNRAV